MSEILKPLRIPIVALAVGLGGVGLALLYFDDMWPLALVAAGAVLVLGVILDVVGQRCLPDHPKRAGYLLEGWVLIPLLSRCSASGGSSW